jgi:hypothetical protein
MTDKVDNEQHEKDEVVVDILADGFDDALLTDEQDAADDEGNKGANSGTAGEQSTEEAEPEIPEKYQGKSIHDVIEMHRNLERAYGRHNNELGELRSLTDQILTQQLEAGQKAEQAQTDIDADSLLENPQAAINKAIDANPKLKALQDALVNEARTAKKQAFAKVHPDADAVVNDPRFVSWVQASPARLALFQKAHVEYDYDLGAELLTLYKETHQSDADESQSQARRQMASPTKNAGNSSKGEKKQYFRRADLMRLKAENPDRYEKLQPQILAAYAEGRVK